MHTLEVLRKPLITEKNTFLGEQNKYTFEIDLRANKLEVKRAVQEIFKVTVESVNIINVKGKMKGMLRRKGRASLRKKAIVTLRKGDRIELFEGV